LLYAEFELQSTVTWCDEHALGHTPLKVPLQAPPWQLLRAVHELPASSQTLEYATQVWAKMGSSDEKHSVAARSSSAARLAIILKYYVDRLQSGKRVPRSES